MLHKMVTLAVLKLKATVESRHTIWRFYFKKDWIKIAQIVNQAEVLPLNKENCIRLCQTPHKSVVKHT